MILIFRHYESTGSAPLSESILRFAKAYIRSQLTHQSFSSMKTALYAFRGLDTAMELLGIKSVCDCDSSAFDKALEPLAPSSANVIGPQLGLIARFMEENGLCRYPVGMWKYHRRGKSTFGRVGREFDERRRKGLPDPTALDALAQAYRLAAAPKDVVITSLAAIMCAAPERINEVLVLPSNCEVEPTSSNGKTYLGLRWAGSKGFNDHVKLMLPGMADVVREALAKIRNETAEARRMAFWYESNPNTLYLPKSLEHLRRSEFITADDLGKLLGLSHESANKSNIGRWVKAAGIPVTPIVLKPGSPATHLVKFADFERHMIGLLPRGFPIYDVQTGLRYSDALLTIPYRLFTVRDPSKGCLCMFEKLKYHHFGNSLGQNGVAGSATVFQRVGIDPDRKFKITSHQFRHWLNTLAQG